MAPPNRNAHADAQSITAVLRGDLSSRAPPPPRTPATDSAPAAALTHSVAAALSLDPRSAEARVAARRAAAAASIALTPGQRSRHVAAALGLPPDAPGAGALAAEIAGAAGALDDAAAATAARWNAARAARYDDLLARGGVPDARPRAQHGALGGGGARASAGPSSSSGSARGSGGGGSSRRLPASWLRERVARATASGGGDVSAGEAAASVLSLLEDSRRTDDELQGVLFDALAYDFDAVAEVLARRAEVVADADAVLADCLGAPEPPPTHNVPTPLGAARRRARDARLAVQDAPPLPGLGGSAAAELQRQFPGVVPGALRAIGAVDRTGLPEGAVRTTGPGFDEIFVPPPKPGSNVRVGRLIEVTDAFATHPELLQAMRGVTTFNRLQSAVFPVAYESPDNLLVCAPTGAGKTNVALLTIFQQIIAVKTRAQTDFKIVYVAPMKALAAEVVEKFGKKLAPLGLRVREFTGDMSLTRREAAETHVLVTTPEKWDVVTRKSASNLSSSITLLILDEVHLLHDDRGAVLESIIARTLRLAEAAEKHIRLVGLSATLPNYKDVAEFLKVDPARGLFHFDAGYRPVPLSQTFIGVTTGGTGNSRDGRFKAEKRMTEITWEKVRDSLQRGHQAMVFVHSRKQTASTARDLIGLAAQDGCEGIFLGGESSARSGGPSSAPSAEGDDANVSVMPTWASREIGKSRSADIRELCMKGIGIHNAGLPRPDRKLVERLFAEGVIRALCCTATLAWGVNLPARTVVIKGTDVYNAEKGGFEQLGMLDVMQIFGRAGRPQFDTEGEGIIITKHEHLARYLNLLTAAVPIESTLGASASKLADHLNAEVVSGTVASIGEGVKWLSYTYLSVRMPKNPLCYGIDWDEVNADPRLHSRRATLVEQASRALDDARMCRYDPRTGSVASTELGRVCSHFYVSHRTVVVWNELLDDLACFGENSESETNMEKMYSAILHAVSCASEFEQMRSRQEELNELDALTRLSCPIPMKMGAETREGKVSILLQAYISRATVRMSDLSYIVQSCTRLLRALFEISIRRGLQGVALAALDLARASECQIWPFQHPLLQFSYHGRKGSGYVIPGEIIAHLDELGEKATVPALRKLDDAGLADIVRFPKNAQILKRTVRAIPLLNIVETSVGPVTRSLLRFRVVLRPDFKWNESIHGNMESWWFWIEDRQEGRIYYSERIVLNKTQVQNLSDTEGVAGNGSTDKGTLLENGDNRSEKGLVIDVMVPVFDPPSSKYWIKVESEHWHTGGGSSKVLNLAGMLLPQREPPQTDILDLRPLPVQQALPARFAKSYHGQFTHFNPIQTQLFHVLYHSDNNIFASMPLGSGKTALAEFAMFRAARESPQKCVIYMVPFAGLAKKRTMDWKRRFGTDVFARIIGIHEPIESPFSARLSVDPTDATLFVTTPEAWYAYAKDWAPMSFRENVSTVIADEMHLLGESRGHEMEVALSRMRYLSSIDLHTETDKEEKAVRMIGLSAPLANPMEFADWLAVDLDVGVFNFRPSVRPVSCEIQLHGIAEELYMHRMQSMNRLIYSSVLRFSSRKGTLVFTSSTRQARLTAQDLLRSASLDGKPQAFLRNIGGNAAEFAELLRNIHDSALRNFLQSGIGIVHSALHPKDLDTVAKLFENGYAMVVITTFSAGWETKLRAAQIVIKGTEIYSSKEERFIDVGIVDILQMIGKAGRANLDTECHAVVLAHERKKTLLKKFLFDPLPVESQLHRHLYDHVLREITSGRVREPQDASDFLTWTFLFRRLVMNPAFYGVLTRTSSSGKSRRGRSAPQQSRAQISIRDIEKFSSSLVAKSMASLSKSGVVRSQDRPNEKKKSNNAFRIEPSNLGWICVRSGISAATGAYMSESIKASMKFSQIVEMVSHCIAEDGIAVNVSDVTIEHVESSLPNWYLAISGKESRSKGLDSLGITGKTGTLIGKLRLLIHASLSGVSVRRHDFQASMKVVQKNLRKYLNIGLAIAGDAGMMLTTQRFVILMQGSQNGFMPSAPVSVMIEGVDRAECRSLFEKLNIRDVESFVHSRKELMNAARDSKLGKELVKRFEQHVICIPDIEVVNSVVVVNDDASYVHLSLKLAFGNELGRRMFTNQTRGRGDGIGPAGWIVFVGDLRNDAAFAVCRLKFKSEKEVHSVQIKLPGNVGAGHGTSLDVKIVSEQHIGVEKLCQSMPKQTEGLGQCLTNIN